jgi:hypothetical protein
MVDTPLMQINQARSSVWLPELTVDTLLDRKKRVALYGATAQQAPQQVSTQEIADFDKWFWLSNSILLQNK